MVNRDLQEDYEPSEYENLPSDVRADIEAEDFKDLES